MDDFNPYRSPEALPERVADTRAPYDDSPGSRSKGMATASFTLGVLCYAALLGTCIFWPAWLTIFPMSLAAVICGHVARGRIRQGIDEGNGLAVAGLISGYLALVLWFLPIGLLFLAVLLGRPRFD